MLFGESLVGIFRCCLVSVRFWGFLFGWFWFGLLCCFVLVFCFFFPKIIFPSRTQVQNTDYCFIYGKVDYSDGYIMGKK